MKPVSFRLVVFLTFLLCINSALPAIAGNRALFPASASTAAAQFPGKPPVMITIPGPLRSFLRMAAISQQISPQQVLPLLARNVAMEGYSWRGKTPEPTEYLILLKAYLKHARDLRGLAGPDHVIRVSACDAAQPLLTALGYRLRTPCGPGASIQAAAAKKAFLTIDSGFPLTKLVASFQKQRPFAYAFPSAQVPVLFSPADWISIDKRKDKKGGDDLIDAIIGDPSLARLYWALSRMDAKTRSLLLQSPGLGQLVPLAGVLDFYGTNLYVRSGRVAVPGGTRAESAWEHLVGASPSSPSAFITHLLEKDQGWLAAYYSALSWTSGQQQAYFTEPHRLRRFYQALRGESIYPSPARPVFRPNPGLMLLVTRLQLQPNGQPHIPGNLGTWKEIFRSQRKSNSKIVRLWAREAGRWRNSDQLVAGLFALSRVTSNDNPLRIFLVLSEIDSRRPPDRRLRPRTVRLLAKEFPVLGDQYSAFSEFSALSDSSITRFVHSGTMLDRIHDRVLRADAIGIFQANFGLWQILARQGQIPVSHWNESFQQVIYPLSTVRSSVQLFDATRRSLAQLWQAAAGTPHLTQDEFLVLLAGPNVDNPDSQRVRLRLAFNMNAVLEAQRLTSLDTLFALGDGLKQMARGKAAPKELLALAGELRESPMPKPLFSSSERAEWSYGIYSNSHLQAEQASNLIKIIKSPRSDVRLAAARGLLTPYLRDTLVGLNYAYYQPPGAQVLYNDPLFVKSHDFLGETIIGAGEQAWKIPTVVGRGWTAGGGAHLVGSLAGLPYVLAEVEQDFIVPRNVQALVWEDLVPTLLMNSVVPRWWHVTPNELHAVALYQQLGEELVKAAAHSDPLRQQVLAILSDRMLLAGHDRVAQALRADDPQEAVSLLTPADLFGLAAAFQQRFPSETSQWGKAGKALEELSQRYPDEVSLQRLSEDFGVPHPALADTYACQLLDVKPFPTFLGYSSRLLAESWQSNNLYWARLADEMGYPPVMLNLLVPQLTRNMIANIFATDLQDWPALLRALHQTGQAFRRGKLVSLRPGKTVSGL